MECGKKNSEQPALQLLLMSALPAPADRQLNLGQGYDSIRGNLRGIAVTDSGCDTSSNIQVPPAPMGHSQVIPSVLG